ncbi:transglutaminase-like domain-containing protein [Mangrovivirga sp. M17]|uniref:Transglutaminase-like domain-containing protein n=1 Tax=Mangrovivirga halotolerans TaxID=2993936 RepID=A0ABT3RNC6_9BACT|nr:transglutaminase-like domain-containing protein [Mangrovivirga halotolerans]MCX2743100.1 transglutaminase-like domain-containing protein [Mangrovivirga halotolerans]
METSELSQYTKPSKYIDSDHPEVVRFMETHTAGISDTKEKLIALYYAVRDGFRYDPYRLDFSEEAIKASHITSRNYGYCIEKSNLFTAAVRAMDVPARMGFAIVTNHIGTEKLEKILKTNKLVFHGYSEIYFNNRWIKVTPVFNKELCQKLDVEPLEFDGEHDAVFQEYSNKGGRFMEYLHDYGTFQDIPYQLMISELAKHYPHLIDEIIKHGGIAIN